MQKLESLDINGSKKAWAGLRRVEFGKGLIEGMNEYNSKLAIRMLKEFEGGINCTTKGIRTQASLLRIRGTWRTLSKLTKNKNIDELTKEELTKIIIKKNSEDFASNVKIIYNWLVRINRIKENPIKHISPNDFSKGKPAWVYLGEEKMKSLLNSLSFKYKALAYLVYDSGIRPEEAWRLRVFDLQENYTILHIVEKRNNGERVAKKNSFERKVKLKLCTKLIKEFIELEKLKTNDLLFNMTQAGFNKALRVVCVKLFGTDLTKAREYPNKITCYDIRHNSACFWLKRYKTNKDLMYRFGWKSEDKVFYYTEFLDMRDTIDDEDLITKEDKTQMENEVKALQKENTETKKSYEELQNQVRELIQALTDAKIKGLEVKKIEN